MTNRNTFPGFLNLCVILVLLTGILVAIAMHIWFASQNPNAGFHFSDAVKYLFMADWFSGARDETTALMVEKSTYPPLFPLFLSVSGAGTDTIVAAHLATATTLFLASLSVFWWLSEEKLSLNYKLFSVLLLLIIPGIFLHSFKIVSEYLFLTMMLGAIASLKKAESDQRWIFTAAILVGLSIATRTVGIALLPGLFLASGKLGVKRLIACALLALGPFMTWKFIVGGVGQEASYSDFLLHFLHDNTVPEILGFVGSQLEVLFYSWIKIFDRWGSPHVVGILAILLLLAGAVFLTRLRELQQDALYLVFYCGIIFVWPFPLEAERFLLILIPFFLFYCLVAAKRIADLARNWIVGAAILTVVPLILLLSTFPTLAFFLERYQEPVVAEIEEMKYTPGWYASLDAEYAIFWASKAIRIYGLLERVEDHVDEGQCIYSVFFDFVVLYTKRESVYLPLDMYNNLDSGAKYDVSKLDQCNYILFMDNRVKQVPEYVGMYPFLAVQSQVEPVLVASLTHEGKEYVVAALAEIKR